jgi:hypothetical protein
MASTGLGRGLATLLAESAHRKTQLLATVQLTHSSGTQRTSRDLTLTDPTPINRAELADKKKRVIVRLLLFSDAMLVGIAGWLSLSERLRHSLEGMVLATLMVAIGAILGCVAVRM